MYEEDDDFITPDKDTIIWRYMDFAKYVEMIKWGRLHFTKLSYLRDKYEMQIPSELMSKHFSINEIGYYNKNYQDFKNKIGVNCWTICNNENEGLWIKYVGKKNTGVAIKSTVGRLIKSMRNYSKRPIFIGEIRYSYKDIDFRNPWQSLMYKRPFYEYEKELRAVTQWSFNYPHKNISGNGIPVDIDIDDLIDQIYLFPGSSDWFSKLVNFVLKDHDYEFKAIIGSEINL